MVFEIIEKMLTFVDEGDFYFLQILQRKKDNPEIGSNSRVIKTYYIKSVDELNDGVVWSPKQSGKLMAHYIDDMKPTEWHDKHGNVWNSNDKFGIMLDPIGFDMSLAEEYRKLIEILNLKVIQKKRHFIIQ